MSTRENVVVIGSGIAGMEASLMLSQAGKTVYLVERLPLIGGNVIKTGESFPEMECSTCLVAPIQQEILQSKSIKTLTYSEIQRVRGEKGNFDVTIYKKARYVDLSACLGCGMCYPVCPVSQSNIWEENLVEKKAIYVECAGSLPNVPVINSELCMRLNGSDECDLCKAACMFGAIDFDQKDEEIEINCEAIIVAAGFDTLPTEELKQYGYGRLEGVYTARELERLLASNGPTEGKILMRDGKTVPSSVAILHCAGRDRVGYCSNVCCCYSARYAHFLREKVPGIKVYDLYSDLCLADKHYQKLHEETRRIKAEYILRETTSGLLIEEKDKQIQINYVGRRGKQEQLRVDMLVLTVPIVPAKGLTALAELLEIEVDKYGFLATDKVKLGSVGTSREGIYVAGCAEGPKDIPSSVMQAEAAVGLIMSETGN